MDNKKASKKENEKESPIPMLVLLTTIGIGMFVLIGFIFLAD
jgi:hypothetical protein